MSNEMEMKKNMTDSLHEQSVGPWKRLSPVVTVRPEYEAEHRREKNKQPKIVRKIFVQEGERYRSLGKFPVAYGDLSHVVSDRIGLEIPLAQIKKGKYNPILVVVDPAHSVFLEFMRHVDGSPGKRLASYAVPDAT